MFVDRYIFGALLSRIITRARPNVESRFLLTNAWLAGPRGTDRSRSGFVCNSTTTHPSALQPPTPPTPHPSTPPPLHRSPPITSHHPRTTHHSAMAMTKEPKPTGRKPW